LELAEDKIPNLVGLKHSSRELPNAHRCMLLNPKKFQVMIGSDDRQSNTSHGTRKQQFR
jgi:dihydrodipicolinate synthase/N-acetylneuraminate lyase